MSRVPSAHLEILRLPELRHHCEKLGVPKSGNKGELISRLVTARISYDNLLMDDLKDILDDMELPVSGNKSELIARIIGRDSSSARGASSASEVIRGNQRLSEVNHRHSLAIRGQTDPRRPHRVLSDHRTCARVCAQQQQCGHYGGGGFQPPQQYGQYGGGGGQYGQPQQPQFAAEQYGPFGGGGGQYGQPQQLQFAQPDSSTVNTAAAAGSTASRSSRRFAQPATHEVRPIRVQSEVIRCIQQASQALSGTQRLSEVIKINQRPSLAISGHQ